MIQASQVRHNNGFYQGQINDKTGKNEIGRDVTKAGRLVEG